jgi:hypothetical protein
MPQDERTPEADKEVAAIVFHMEQMSEKTPMKTRAQKTSLVQVDHPRRAGTFASMSDGRPRLPAGSGTSTTTFASSPASTR